MMEHRLYRRHDIEAWVRLYLAGESIGLGRVKNIGASGMHVRYANLNLSVGQIIHIKFVCLAPYDLHAKRIRAMVVHSSSKHIGLLFDYDLKINELMMRLNQAAHHQENLKFLDCLSYTKP